jgi:glycosyltransferase involved in cell wall biosynthesis
MRILHLYSDWKWTGPAEPAVELVAELKKQGVEVRFACSPLPFPVVDSIEKHVRARGIEPITDFHLSKHFSLWRNFRDERRLVRYLDAEHIDIVHAHRHQDHWIGGRAARRTASRVRIVRTCHDGVPQPRSWRNRMLYRRYTDVLVDVSRQALEEDIRRFSLSPGQALHVPPAVDTARFRREGIGNLRQELGIPREAAVLGVVARIQPHRRFDLLFEAYRRVAQRHPESRLLLVGRGTRRKEVAEEPIDRLGLSRQTILAGYRREDYLEAMNTLDALVFLVPGSDGSCRAARQALSMGKPVIATRRGMLPEVIRHRENGLLVDETPEALAEAMSLMIQSPETRTDLGRRATEITRREHTVVKLAERIRAVYDDLSP